MALQVSEISSKFEELKQSASFDEKVAKLEETIKFLVTTLQKKNSERQILVNGVKSLFQKNLGKNMAARNDHGTSSSVYVPENIKKLMKDVKV